MRKSCSFIFNLQAPFLEYFRPSIYNYSIGNFRSYKGLFWSRSTQIHFQCRWCSIYVQVAYNF
ncbi:hypothetical protein MKW98_006817, partial [Papaver atlanticum]